MKKVRLYGLLIAAAFNLRAKEPLIEKSKELTPEIKLMQEIEPGFWPKSEKAVELFMLQKQASQKDEAYKKTVEEIKAARERLLNEFRKNISVYLGKKTALLTTDESSIDEAIKYLELALKYSPNHPEYAVDAMYQLGYYYFERDEKDYFEKLAKYSEARDQGREDVVYPEEDFHRTIDLYEQILDSYPNYSQLESVHYLLGLALWYEGAYPQAVKTFKALESTWPDSRYAEEVRFRLGEFYYDMNEYDEAIAAYQKVAANPTSPLYDKAIYKMAWSHFQKDRFMLAVENFLKVLDLTYQEKGDSAASSMRAEVTRYIVKSFSDELYDEERYLGRVKITKDQKNVDKDYAELMGTKLANKIIMRFSDSTKPYVKDILLETASQLLDESKADGAIKIFDAIIARDKNNQDNPRYQSQIVDILQEADRLNEAREQNLRLIEAYKKGSPWYLFQVEANNLAALRNAREAVRDAMLALAVHYHKTGKELKLKGDEKAADLNFDQAAKLYLAYINEYPERDDTHKALLYFAESAFEISQFRTALDAYELLKEYPLPMPENFRRDATFNIVFTFRHVLESEAKAGRFKQIDFDALTSKSRGLEVEAIPELGLKYLSSIEDFLKIAPSDEQVPVLLFHAAAIYYVYGHTDEALARFFYIIDNYPKTAAANVSARLILDDAVAKEDWARVIELSKKFKGQLEEQSADFQRFEGTARFKLARAIFEAANELKKSNQLGAAKEKYQEAASLFANILLEDPKNPFADIMLFNSARAIAESGTLTEALPLYRRLYTEYPNSDFAKPARFQEALALEKMLKFSEAAKAYDAIIKQDDKSESAGDAMLNVAMLQEAAGDLGKAAQSYLMFAKKYPGRVEALEALLSSAAVYKRMGNTSQQIAMLEQFAKQYRNDVSKAESVIEAYVQIGDTYSDLEKSAKTSAQKDQYRKSAMANYRSAVGLFSQDLDSPLASFYAAKAQLILEKPEQDSFRTMKINGRLGKEQSVQMTAMLKKLTELSAKNEAIIKAFAQPVWNAESLRRIGALYEHLAKAMLAAPCPRDVESVDEFACDEYVVLLEDKAAILEEKAVLAYKQAYDIAISAYDAPPDLVSNILLGLNRMKPGQYQPVGNLIERPVTGSVEGLGRMLSNGKMASSLHPDEVDPDLTPKAIEPEVKKEPALKPEEKDEPVKPMTPSEEKVEDSP